MENEEFNEDKSRMTTPPRRYLADEDVKPLVFSAYETVK